MIDNRGLGTMKETLRNVTLRQLQIFMVAAEHESYARAAEILYLTQPAVSMQMKRLVEMVGIELFSKTGRDLKLTPAGEALLPYVRQLNQTLREAGEKLDDINGLKHGRVNLGMVTTTQYFSPRLTTEFKKKHPEIELNITIANRSSIINKLENNEIDLAIIGRLPKRISVEAIEFYNHPYVMIAPYSHPLAKQTNISAQSLKNEIFLAREGGSGTRMILDSFFIKNELTPRKVQNFTSNESIKQSVMVGMGLAIISAHTVHLETQTQLLSILDVETMPTMRAWYISHLSKKVLSPAANAFKEFMQQEAPMYMETIFPEYE